MKTEYKLYMRVLKPKPQEHNCTITEVYFCVRAGNETEVTNFLDVLVEKFIQNGYVRVYSYVGIKVHNRFKRRDVLFTIEKEDIINQGEYAELVDNLLLNSKP